MSGKKMYSTELKLEIVERYQKGDIGAKKLAEQYHVSKSDIQKWNAAVAEQADAQDLKSCGTYTPVPVRFRFAALCGRSSAG